MAKYKCPNCGGEFDEWYYPTEGSWLNPTTDNTTATAKRLPRCPFCGIEQGKYVPPKRVEYPFVPYEQGPPPIWYQPRVWCSNSSR